jgi:hypothetical protein
VNCAYCSSALPDGAMFCGECGRSVVNSSSASAVGGSVLKRDTVVADELIEPPTPVSGEPIAAAQREAPDLGIEACAQCGSPLDVSDIFCGECGFVRHIASKSRPSDTAALDPFPWGSPTEAAQTEGAGARNDDPVLDMFEHDVAETRIVDRSTPGERFVLQFSTGESVSVTGTGLLGRNPLPEPGEYFDAMIAISDPGKSVSKSHLEFGQDAGAFWVSDRFSGNGTVVREPDSPPKRCDAGKRYRIARGTRVDIGEQFFIVS